MSLRNTLRCMMNIRDSVSPESLSTNLQPPTAATARLSIFLRSLMHQSGMQLGSYSNLLQRHYSV